MEFKIFLYIVIIFSAVFHEFFHGWTASRLGDQTAKLAGRLTLNPLKHLDLFGTVLLPLFLLFFTGAFLGWAKPVPYNPYNLRDQKWGSTKVAFAGPAANFIIALALSAALRFVPLSGFFYISFSWIVYINIFLGLFNLLPFPPLDGSKLLIDLFPSQAQKLLSFSLFGIFIAIFTAMYILSPIARLLFYSFTGAPFMPYAF